MADVIRLATSQANKPIRACDTCRYYARSPLGVIYGQCHAVSRHAMTARAGECDGGGLWERRPAPTPLLVRIKRYFVG